jgi:hypothetical protein
MMVVSICSVAVMIDKINREICAGAYCKKYETEEQFKIAYELIEMIIKFCVRKTVNEALMEAVKRQRDERCGVGP